MTVKIHLEKFWYHSGFLNTRSYLSTTIFYINWESINLYFEGCMTCTLTKLQVSGWVYLGRQYELCYSKKKKKKRERERKPEYGINTDCQCQYIVPKVDLHTEGCWKFFNSTLPLLVADLKVKTGDTNPWEVFSQTWSCNSNIGTKIEPDTVMD